MTNKFTQSNLAMQPVQLPLMYMTKIVIQRDPANYTEIFFNIFCNIFFLTSLTTMSTSVPMDECQSSHIKNIMTRLTTIKCDKIVWGMAYFALVMWWWWNTEKFGHHNFADLALWFFYIQLYHQRDCNQTSSSCNWNISWSNTLDK